MKQTVFGRLEDGEWQEYDHLCGMVIDEFEGVYKYIIQMEPIHD